MPLSIHRAERSDVLVDGLARVLAEAPEDPFERDVVVVGAAGVERWLAQSLSHRLGAGEGRADGICAGVDLVRPHHLLTELSARERHDPWSPDALAWSVRDVLERDIDEPWLEVVATHVGHGLAPAEEALRRSRRWTTARRTASLLHGYALQRPWMVRAWAAGDDVDGTGERLVPANRWQAELWRRLLQRLDGHPSPEARLAATAERLRGGEPHPALPARLSLLGHTRVPYAELDVLSALGHAHDVHLWLPHPSRARWTSTTRAVDTGRPLSRSDVEPPESGNALLTACGRDVTELQLALQTHAGGVADVEHLPGPERPDTLLGHLQSDLAADRPGPAAPRVLHPADVSVQVHACHGIARQVDVLREVVLGLLEDDPTLEPRDVLVMCPDVEVVAPLVTAAFGLADTGGVRHPGHGLRVRLADRSAGAVNPVAEVLQAVVAIAAGRRTSVAEVRDLLALAPVRHRFGLTEDDLEDVDTWVEATAVRWGVDADSRAPWGLDGLAQNTWRAGLDRLAVGVAADPGTGVRLGDVLPVDDLPSTGADLVGRLHEALARLFGFLDAARPQPIGTWVELLVHAVDALTATTPRDAWQREQVVRRLGTVAADGQGDPHPLTVVEVGAVLDSLLGARPTRSSFRTGSLTVCSMVPMRSVPHRVVCLLGLDADAFPRTPTPLGDDVLARHPLVGERDAAAEDRQLFLDALMSATETLVVAYTGASEHTGRPLPPATPVGEMLDQLERSVPGADVREHVLVRHPLQGFDARSFTRGALLPDRVLSFDEAALAGARATLAAAHPVPPFLDAPLPAPEADVVTLDALRSFVRHPVRSFVRDRLGVSLPYEEDAPEAGVPLHLDALRQWEVNRRLLSSVLDGASGEQADADERRRGLLPPGALADKALARAHETAGRLYGIAAPLRETPGRSIDVDLTLPDGRRVVGTVADVHGTSIVRVTPSTLRGAQLLMAWVDVLALAASGAAVPADLVGRVRRGGRASPGLARLGAPQAADATAMLTDLLDLWRDGQSGPLALPVKTSEAAAAHLRRQGPRHLERAVLSEWSGNRDLAIPGEDVDVHHVLALGPGLTVRDLLDRGMDQLALRLWNPVLDHWDVS